MDDSARYAWKSALYAVPRLRAAGNAAELFLREGACVAVCGSNEKLVAQINARAEREGLSLLAVTADITSAPQLKHLFSETERRFGRIDVLINNAGMGCPDGFLTLQDDLWAREIDVNLTAVSEACRLVLPYFRKAGSGCILSTSSLGGSAMMQRMGEPEEIAAAMVFLAPNLSRFCVPVLSRWLALGPLLCYTVCQIHGKGGGVLQIEIKQEQQLSAQQLQSLQVLQMSGSACALLRELVAGEDRAHPQSDEALCACMKARGCDISRRTVAKYRQQLGIPNSTQRMLGM